MTKVAYMFGGMNRGGAETLMLDVFRNWRNAPFEFIGIHRKDGAMHDAFYSAGPKLYQLAPKRFGYIRYIMHLRRVLKSENISVIHAQHWLDGIYAWLATIGMHVKLVTTLHGFYSMKGLNGFLCRMSIRMADDVCYVSRYEQDWYQQQMQIQDAKCHVIYNGVDFSKFDVESKSVRELGNEGRIRLCMVGNFGKVRSQNIIVHSIYLLKKRGISDFEFYFIGRRSDTEPHLYDECEQICKHNNMKHVHFLGARNDVPALLKAMNGFVYSSANDTFGVAVVEAMYAGLPIVVNDWPVMKEVCGESENNAVTYFRTEDIEDCAQKMLYLIDHLHEGQQAALDQSVLAREYYSMDAYFTRLIKIYTYHDIN